MEGGTWTFPHPHGAELKPARRYVLGTWTGTMHRADLSGSSLYKVTLRDLDFRYANLQSAELEEVRFEDVDLRGANLSGVRKLHTVIGLNRSQFDDDSVLDSVDLDAVSLNDASVGRRLRRIRYAGKLKRTKPWVYWPWQILCSCGRSWPRFACWTLVLVVTFSVLFRCGLTWKEATWLPHLVSRATSPVELGMWHCVEFSLLTFLGVSTPGIEWSDLSTGFWVGGETLVGLAFLGVFISIIAVHVSPQE